MTINAALPYNASVAQAHFRMNRRSFFVHEDREFSTADQLTRANDMTSYSCELPY